MNRIATFALTALLGACTQSAERDTLNTANVAQQPMPPVEDARNVALPDDRTPLAEPRGAIDPKSVEAAGQVVQSFGALIEQRRFAEAEALLGDNERARTLLDAAKKNRETHLEIGKPGEMEGAAGSVYLTVPVVAYGQGSEGQPFRQRWTVFLRRVNDVPGSTAKQRRWHIWGWETGLAP